MFETVLIGLVLLTIALNALVQLLVRGRVDRLLSGLGVGPGTSLQGKCTKIDLCDLLLRLSYKTSFVDHASTRRR